MKTRDAAFEFDLELSEEGERQIRAMAAALDEDTGDPEPDTIIPVDKDWGCCDDQKPRIHHGSGRFFCANCRAWLDQVRGDLDAQDRARDDTTVDQTGDATTDA